MRSPILSYVVVATVSAWFLSASATAQQKREPQGAPLPDYAKVYPVPQREAPLVSPPNELPNIMVTGYWPPTNEMLRRFSESPIQNPDGWVGEDWEGRGYNIYAFFPEFPMGLGKGEGDFEVDYQDTSADFWAVVAQLEPIAIVTTGRADDDFDWELEGGHRMYALSMWVDDYLEPFDPTPDLPIAAEPAGNDRFSTLPMQAIVDAVDAAVPALNVYSTALDDSRFLCNFAGYHATWYHDMHNDPTDPLWVVAAGHIHVGSAMNLADAIEATEVTLRTLTTYLDAQLSVFPPAPETMDAACATAGDCAGAWAGADCVGGFCYIPKNRYLSIDPTVNAVPVAYQVELTEAAGYPGAVGRTWWVDEPQCYAYPSGAVVTPKPETCLGSDRFGWVARLVADPVERVWTESPVHVTGCGVAPAVVYEMRASEDEGTFFSAPLVIGTIRDPEGEAQSWGDLTGGPVSGMPGLWLAPEQAMGFADIGAAIRTFEGRTDGNGCPPPIWCDMEINQVVNLGDIQFLIKAFEGSTYASINLPFIGMDPTLCP